MKPLVFLTYRSLVNGIRRAITTPKRLFSLLAVVGYYFFFFVLPGLRQGTTRGLPAEMHGRLPFPPMELIDAFAFGVFAVLSLIMMLGVFSYRGGFRPADVDVLFATPVSPKTVLWFRIAREYLGTLILPFFLALVFFRPAAMGWDAIFRNVPSPDSSRFAFRAMTVSWMLMAMVWVSVAYAASLFINRSDRRSDLNKKIIDWSASIGFMSLVAFVAWRVAHVSNAHDLVTLSQHPVLRAVFFTATAAAAITLAPLQGNYLPAVLGAGGLIACIVIALRLALTQVSWLYDQAAVRGFGHQATQALQAKGDFFGMAAERARSRKAKPQRRTWLHRLRIQGPAALIWKEYFLQKRGMQSMLIIMLLPALVLGAVPVMMPSTKGGDKVGPIMFLAMQAMIALMITMNTAATGFIEVLRRVDVQKPLPFSPTTTAFMEIVSKAIAASLACVFAIVVAMVFKPGWWSYGLGGLFFSPALALVASATAFLVTVLFPDQDDQAQRQFHRLVLFLGVVILALPSLAIGAGMMAVGVPVPFAGLAAAVVNVAIAFGVASLAGGLYAAYNPSE